MAELKVSPKFKTHFLSDKPPDDPRLEILQKWCREFTKCGLMPPYKGGSYGNLSFRTEGDRFIITASGMKDPASRDSFVAVTNVDLKGNSVDANGKREPSSESMLHYMIYRERKDVNAVFHGHCKKILEHADKMAVPITLKEEQYGTIELARSVLEVIDGNDFLVMKGHGFISLGKSLNDAGELAMKIMNSIDKKTDPLS